MPDPSDFELHLTSYAATRTMERHSHPHSSVSLVLSGAVEEEAEGGRRRERSLAVLVKPAGTVHADRFHDARLFGVRVDASIPLGPYRWRRDPAVVRRALALMVADREGRPAREVAAAFDELLRELRSEPGVGARCDAVPGAGATGDEVPSWLREARERMEAARGGLGPGEAARGSGVHPVHFARCFRRAFGLSPRELAQRLRVEEAADRLGRRPDSLAAIALQLGFADQAHFTRVFRERTGLPPSRFRRLVDQA